MAKREDYLIERLDGELRRRGYRGEQARGGSPLQGFDAVYRHGRRDILCIEHKMPHLYLADEFRGLIGDAILRFQNAAPSVPARRLMLAFLIGRMSRNAEHDLQDYASHFLPDLQWLLLAETDGDVCASMDGTRISKQSSRFGVTTITPPG